MQTGRGLLIVGGGHAGSELAMLARQGGWDGRIVLLTDEAILPYQRPPLSKAYLSGVTSLEAIQLRPVAAYEIAKVELKLGTRVEAIEPGHHRVKLSDGAELSYDKLAWCAGGRPRPLSCVGLNQRDPPANLFYLRSVADANSLRAHLHKGVRLAVIGGGYIGLEVAASARALGAEVTVLEAQSRVLARVAGPDVSRFYERVHEQEGVDIRTGVVLDEVHCERDRIVGVRLADGTTLRADLFVAGVGMIPNIEPAIRAGFASAEGIVVDSLSRTSEEDIVAAGDCTVQQHAIYDRSLRIESVPNALEQARAAASWLCGKPVPNRSVPWFWSDQYDMKLQMAGLSNGYDQCVIRGDIDGRSFSAFYLAGERLLAVDAVNKPMDFMQVKRALAGPVNVRAEALSDERIPLKEALS